MEIITLLAALSISGVAAYYSIIGLAKIFAASMLSVVIMGTVLEVGKIVTALWLHRNWSTTPKLLRTYLTGAVIVLMLITSMGIFGFLSSAHIEQTAESKENLARISQIDNIIDRNRSIISDSEKEIDRIRNSGSNKNEEINGQIERELTRIENVRSQYNELVREQNNIIESASSNLNLLERYITEQNIEGLQSLVGARVDGNYGSRTANKVDEFRKKEEERVSSIVSTARERITELRNTEQKEISRSNELIDRLRQSIGTNEIDDTQLTRIERLRNNIISAEETIDNLTEEKYTIEGEYRKLEAEVGPVKYIAEFVYGTTDTEVLEDAVRWVIIAIIFVFDPLAILLLIAAQMSYVQKSDKSKENYPQKSVDDLENAKDLLIKTDTGWQRLKKTQVKRKETLEKVLDKDT
jgi:hypothetical protein